MKIKINNKLSQHFFKFSTFTAWKYYFKPITRKIKPTKNVKNQRVIESFTFRTKLKIIWKYKNVYTHVKNIYLNKAWIFQTIRTIIWGSTTI